MKGTVKMFNNEKGFGFIQTEDGRDVFFHYTSLQMPAEYKSAVSGEQVEFEVEESDRGLRAVNIKKI